jgi:hypothetical protein
MIAVEARRMPTQCKLPPILSPNPPQLHTVWVGFSDDLDESPSTDWVLSNRGVYAEYVPRDWQWTTDLPEGGSGGAFYAPNSGLIGDCEAGSDDQSGVMSLESPPIQLPVNGTPLLAFDHWIASEPSYDGGNLKISINGGDYRLVEGDAFRFNSYNTVLNTAMQENTNPMAGEGAFSGINSGTSRGSWGQSQVDLSEYAGPGDSIRLRFDFGVDGCNGVIGWYVDNVSVVSVADRTPRKPLRRHGG